MDAFQTTSIIAVGGLLLALALHYAIVGRHARVAVADGVPARRGGRAESAATWLGTLALLALAATGFVGVFGWGRLGGWLLLAHMFAAAVFLLAMAVVAVMWAERRAKLSARDWSADPRRAGRPGGIGWCVMFWLGLVLGVVVAGSMLLSMWPLFGYTGQAALLTVHRYGGLGLVVVLVVHAYVARVLRRG